MSWIVLHFIGIISYAATGAFIALEARFSFIGVYALGLNNLIFKITSRLSCVFDDFK